MKDFFPTMALKPNPSCLESSCLKRQKEHQRRVAEQALRDAEAREGKGEEEIEEEDVHPENEWGISLASEDDLQPQREQPDESDTIRTVDLVAGLQYAYENATCITAAAEEHVQETSADLEDLMAQLTKL